MNPAMRTPPAPRLLVVLCLPLLVACPKKPLSEDQDGGPLSASSSGVQETSSSASGTASSDVLPPSSSMPPSSGAPDAGRPDAHVADAAAPDAGETCGPGDLRCHLGVPQLCGPDGRWQDQGACDLHLVCAAGRCVTPACGAAAEAGGYLGCEYWVVDLPNYTHVPGRDDTTPTSPTGIVVANPSATDSVTVSLVGLGDTPVTLVSERLVPVPVEPAGAGAYTAQTVRSLVRDASGTAVGGNLSLAQDIVVPASGTATLLLEPAMPELGTALLHAALRLRADGPIVAYQFSPFCCNYSLSNDASLLFPAAALDGTYIFLGVPSWPVALPNPPVPSLPATLVVVGTSPHTLLDIQLPAGVTLLPDGSGTVTVSGNGRVSTTLGQHDVLFLQADGSGSRDLTGARIDATGPVAVFSSHFCSYYPQDLAACDHLEEQLFPVRTWGRQFDLVPTPQRGTPDVSEVTYWKIMARDAGTRVTLSAPFSSLAPAAPGATTVPDCANHLADGSTILLSAATLNFCEFGTAEALTLDADGPLMVMGIVAGQVAAGVSSVYGQRAGDPSIFLVPPRAQYRRDYPILVPGTYQNNFVTVVVDQGQTVTLDGAAVDLTDATALRGSTRLTKHLPLSDGPHRLLGSAPLGIVVFAYDDYVSFAFAGGMDLRRD
jgi:hypothetical protein